MKKDPKTPVWLDPDTLEEEKLFDVENNPLFEEVIKSVGLLKHSLPTKMGEDLLLFVSHGYFTSLNYKTNKIVNQLQHSPQMGYKYDVKVTEIGKQRFWNCANSLYRVELSQGERSKKVESYEKINLLDHLPQIHGLKLERETIAFSG